MDKKILADNIAKLLQRISRSAVKSQRVNSDILVLAVSKTRTEDEVKAAHACGLTHFGENYLQEALDKITATAALDLTWHFIGPIQSNKTRAIAEHFDWVHSVDREKIARRLNDARPAGLAPLQVCLQVNISGEASKAGVDPEVLPQLVATIASLPQLRLRGLMAIPAATDDLTVQHQSFRDMAQALGKCRVLAPDMDTLSMGMSADLEAAVAEGATIIRVGTAIFGPRNS